MPIATLREYYVNPRGKPQGYITVRRAMDIAKCSEPTIRRLIGKGRVKVVRWRDRVLILEKDLAEWSRIRTYRRRKLKALADVSTGRTQHEAIAQPRLEVQP
jgi:hypothetical protein